MALGTTIPLSMRFLKSAPQGYPSGLPETQKLGHHRIVQLMLPGVLWLGSDEAHADNTCIRRSRRRGTLWRANGLEAGRRVGARRGRGQRGCCVGRTFVACFVRGLRDLGKVVDEKSGAEGNGVLAHLRCVHVRGEDLAEEMTDSGARRQCHPCHTAEYALIGVIDKNNAVGRPETKLRRSGLDAKSLRLEHTAVLSAIRITMLAPTECWHAGP